MPESYDEEYEDYEDELDDELEGEEDDERVKAAGAWFTSLMVHGALLLILAFLIILGPSDQDEVPIKPSFQAPAKQPEEPEEKIIEPTEEVVVDVTDVATDPELDALESEIIMPTETLAQSAVALNDSVATMAMGAGASGGGMGGAGAFGFGGGAGGNGSGSGAGGSFFGAPVDNFGDYTFFIIDMSKVLSNLKLKC